MDLRCHLIVTSDFTQADPNRSKGELNKLKLRVQKMRTAAPFGNPERVVSIQPRVGAKAPTLGFYPSRYNPVRVEWCGNYPQGRRFRANTGLRDSHPFRMARNEYQNVRKT